MFDAPSEDRLTVWSVGHSTRTLEGFLAVLAPSRVELVADIRTVPKSRRHPHFHIDELARSLPEHGVRYVHLARLGGWRAPREDSPNGAWRNRSFRGYADYALTAEFADGLAELRALAAGERTAMMCSEALWWRCHRRLVADRLAAGGDRVLHIASGGRTSEHRVAPFAVPAEGGGLVYPAQEPGEADKPGAAR